MKGNESKILIGSLVAAIIIVAAVYKFLYLPDSEEADRIKGECVTIQERVNELNQKMANRPMYEAGINNADDIINQILKKYGPGNTPEKTIMLIVDLCNKTGAKILSIGFGGDSEIYRSEELNEDGTPEIQIFRGSASFSMDSGYTELKKIVDYVNSHPERMNFDNMSMSYSQDTGRLSTSVTLNLYSVIDKNHVYVAPVIEDIEIGNSNLFRSNEPEVPVEEIEEGSDIDSTSDNNTTNEADEAA